VSRQSRLGRLSLADLVALVVRDCLVGLVGQVDLTGLWRRLDLGLLVALILLTDPFGLGALVLLSWASS